MTVNQWVASSNLAQREGKGKNYIQKRSLTKFIEIIFIDEFDPGSE